MAFSTAYARRELIMAAVVAVPLVALSVWMAPSSASDVLDAERSGARRGLAAAVVLLFLVVVLIVVPLLVLAARRLSGTSPGLVLASAGVRVARQAGPLRPLLPWSAIRAIEIQRTSRGQLVVALVGEPTTTFLPIGLAHGPQELHDLLANARGIAVGPQQ